MVHTISILQSPIKAGIDAQYFIHDNISILQSPIKALGQPVLLIHHRNFNSTKSD